MRFEHRNSYAASAEEVRAMLLDPEFRERVCAAQHALEHHVDISGSGDRMTVQVRQTQSMKGAPAVAVKLTGDRVAILQRETWSGPRNADFAMEIPGKPGQLRAALALQDTSAGCDELVVGEVKVQVPLVGGKLEGLIGDILARALRREGEVGAVWLAERADDERPAQPMEG
ncbi:MAG: hypothetical protein QOK15_79 [Nocardioidaceae bacterium]|jgi:hypothetical protein|nr:hypothetical protein [Nocardioidaceae bacterium]